MGTREVKSHALHAAGHCRQLRTGLHRLRQIKTQGAQTADHTQQVVHVVVADQTRVQGLHGLAFNHLKSQTLATGQSTRLQTRRAAPRAGPDVDRTALQLLGQQSALHVIDVDDGRLQTGPSKQSGLGRPIARHVAVVVQMVLGEVGEHGHADAGAVQAVLGQTDGRGFDGAVRHATLGELPELALQQHRVGCGHAGGDQIGQTAHTQGAHQAAKLLQHGRRQRLRQPPGRRCFAIGAGDRQHLQGLAGLFIVGVGHPGGLGLEAGHASQRFWVGALQHVQPWGVSSFFHEASFGTLRQGLRQVTPAIGSRTRPGNEAVTRLHQAAVGAQLARHARAQPAGRFLSAVQGLHQNDSSTAWATI